jgi:hypothetical protein
MLPWSFHDDLARSLALIVFACHSGLIHREQQRSHGGRYGVEALGIGSALLEREWDVRLRPRREAQVRDLGIGFRDESDRGRQLLQKRYQSYRVRLR